MNQIDPNLLRFREFIDPWIPAIRSVSTSYLVTRHGTDAELVSARVVLHPLPPSLLQTRTRTEDKRLVADLAISAANQEIVDAVLMQANAGEIEVGAHRFRLPIDPQGSLRKWSYLDRERPTRNASGPRAPLVQVTGGSRTLAFGRAFDSIPHDWYLRALTPAFADFDDLHSTYGLPSKQAEGDQTYLEVVAYPPLEIADASIVSGGTATIAVHMAEGLDRKKLSVAYKVLRENDVPLRGVCGYEQFTWNSAGAMATGNAQFPVDESAVIECFLRYGEHALQHYWLSDPTAKSNLCHAAYSAFDENLVFLRRLLFEFKKNEAHNFEYGVSLLFDLLGFSVSQHGRIPKLQDGPDIIARSPAGHFVLIECTTLDLNENDKLAKLSRRAETLQSELLKAGHSQSKVYPVLATALRNAQVATQRADAGKREIYVLVKEDLENMLPRTRLLPSPDLWIEETLLHEVWQPRLPWT